MAFNASGVSLEDGLKLIRSTALQEKNYLASWAASLAGSVDAISISNGVQTAQSYAPGVTAPLLALVTTAAATIV